MTKVQPFEFILVFLAFLGCVARAEPSPSATPHDAATLSGSITLHSVTGGPVRQGVPDSRPLTEMTFDVRQDDRTVASFTTDNQGRFRVALPAGHYTVMRKDWKSRVGFFGPFTVDLAAGEERKVAWNCDTGMQ